MNIARLIAPLALTTLLFAACKPDHHAHGDAHAETCTHSLTSDKYDEAEVVAQPGAKVGDLTRCPISGSVFRVAESSPATVQKGQTYYTCCAGCVDQLEADFARRR